MTVSGNPSCTTAVCAASGACYWLVNTQVDRGAALAGCEANGGTLAMLKSAAIHTCMFDLNLV